MPALEKLLKKRFTHAVPSSPDGRNLLGSRTIRRTTSAVLVALIALAFAGADGLSPFPAKGLARILPAVGAKNLSPLHHAPLPDGFWPHPPAAALAATLAWSADPAVNTVLSDRPNDQVQPKIIPAADGGCYVSWYDNASEGYDMALQRLDASGESQWSPGGIQVADLGFSWTMDYGLAVDAAGNALLAFRDDRSGSAQIAAAKVGPDGASAWGSEGIRLTDTIASVAAPKIAATTDGAVVVAWSEGKMVKLQRLNAAGQALWPAAVTLADAAAQFSLADLQAADDGAVIVSWVRGTTFLEPKHLFAQKLSRTGDPLWGEIDPATEARKPLAIFDDGSLQFGNFPSFLPDGAGGAVFTWYGVDPWLTHVQWVEASGTMVFGPDGLLAATARTDRERNEPAAAFDPVRGQIYVFWREIAHGSSNFRQGVYGQMITAAGGRQWGDGGKAIVPLDGNERVQLQALAFGSGALVAYVENTKAGEGRVWVHRLNGQGGPIWKRGRVAAATAPSAKSRLAASLAGVARDFAVFAWSDTRAGSEDIYAQDVNADGSLGPPPPPRYEGFLPAVYHSEVVRSQ